MARAGAAAAALILLVPAGAALTFQVEVGDLSDAAAYDVDVQEEAPLEASATVENPGSVGCRYWLGADLRYGGMNETAWSEPEGIWPGDSEKLELDFYADNHTGEVDGQLFLSYCSETLVLRNFSYEADNPPALGTVDAEVTGSNSSGAAATFGVEEATLVPERTPGGWRVSSTEVQDGEAKLEYDAPLFSRDYNITYRVIKDGEPLGTAEVSLQPSRGLFDAFRGRVFEIALAVSLLLNILLLAGLRPRLEKALNQLVA